MTPLTLEGDTLGQRQHYFNILVNDAVAKKLPFDEIKGKEEKSDIDKLFKIDIASRYRILEYILENLKSDDLLYVSRAIKKSSWLITDRQYSHIVNPQYLNEVLFPEMTAKASCKFMLQVRLQLRDEDRVEQFYKYYDDKDQVDTALKWLPNCSLEFIKDVVAKKFQNIDKDLFKRLCERSVAVLELFVEKNDYTHKNVKYAQAVIFLMNTNIEKYLNVVEKLIDNHGRFHFGPKYTEMILKKCPERIMNDFEKYAFAIDAGILGKHLGTTKAQEFLLKHAKNEKISSWFSYKTIVKLVGEMPKEEKFALIKQVFIDRNTEKINDHPPAMPYLRESVCVKMSCSAVSAPTTSNKNIYQWYNHAPFSVAFTELKKLIRAESSPDERIAMFSVMLVAAGSNMKNVEAVLQYYHDRHINEPFKFKVQFVDHLLAITNTHRFEQNTWKLLEELFHSMEVYVETGNRVVNCVNSIVLYKVLHDETIPEVIEKKFTFNSFKKSINKLSQLEKDKMFQYLYKYLEEKFTQQKISSQEDYDKAISLVDDYFDLLLDWNKELMDYPIMLQKVKEIIYLKKKSWSAYTSTLFDKKKSWRKFLFEESLLLSPSEEACLNALKHDPDLLKRCTSEMDALRYDDNVSLKKLQSKLRVYWPQSLRSEWASAYQSRLQQTGGHKTVVRALCALLPPEELLQIIKQYAPENHKIVWSEADELELSIQKNVAKSMHTARPQPPLDAVLCYAKGDYLQFALPSLTAICYNLSAARCREHFPTLLDAPVSVQKHGIRLVCSKMSFKEIKETLSKTWTSTKNSSIRAVIFQLTHDLLLREKSSDKAEDLWQLLEIFIDTLSQEENKIIYSLMDKVSSSMQVNIQPKYVMKCYTFLKTLPAKFECKDQIENLAHYTIELMDKIDHDFVKGIILDHYEQFYVQKKYQKRAYNSYNNIIASYLIWGKTEKEQLQRYENVFLPMLNFVFSRWNEVQDNQYVVKYVFNELINSLYQMYTQNIFKAEIEVPVKLFKSILNKMEESLVFAKNYMIMRVWQLKVAFVQFSVEARSKLDLTVCSKPNKDGDKCCGGQENIQWNELCTNLIPGFGAQCIKYLKEDVATSPVLHTSFEEALSQMLNSMSFSQQLHNSLYDIFLADPEFVFGYLTVLNLMPTYCYNDADKESLAKYAKLIKAHPSEVVQIKFAIKYSDNPEYSNS